MSAKIYRRLVVHLRTPRLGWSCSRRALWFSRLVLIPIVCGLMALVVVPQVWSESEAGSVPMANIDAFEDGLRLYQQGALEEAAARFQQAADTSDQQGRPLQQSDALTALAHVYVALGYHTKAAQSLELALTLVQQSGDPARQAAVMGAIGQVYLAAGQLEAASEYLTDGLTLARELEDLGRAATILNEMGRLHAIQKNDVAALEAFTESQSLAEKAKLPALSITATLNAGQASLRLGRHVDAQQWLDQALPKLRGLPNSHDKAYGMITLGLAYGRLGAAVQEDGGRFILQAVEVLGEAGQVAQSIGDQRAMSYAFGHQGHFYEQHGRTEDALLLTRLAVTAAQQVRAPESLYQWQWQTGRLLRTTGQPKEAIVAYQQAVDTVQSIRPEMAFTVDGSATSFRESGGRLFFELADLLLERAAATPDDGEAKPYLVEAREAVELFKSAELRDYFRDDCVDALQKRITKIDDLPKISPNTAVVYPIVLVDRTELLVSLPQGIKRFSVQVSADRLTEEVRAFRRFLEKRTTRQFLPHAQQLYEWLIRPMEADLADLSIDTLVMVPDGPLRTIPMASLHDGERFLIQRFAVATTPGLNLTDPHPLQRENVRVLSAGLTEGVQGFAPLPNVMTELQALEDIYGSRPLLNKTFLTSTLEKEMRGQEFTIVHIASHGKFESQVGNSFVLTFDDKLTMDRLSQVVGFFRFRDEPLELLTLSACETAAGDDRAALGLAGVAIKAGARSALATLWFINDQASSALVAEFYRQLQNPALSKAKALQQAQLTLLDNPVYEHPSYWAPFLLLNNWL